MSCTESNVLYVGESRQTVRKRMNQHRSGYKDPQFRVIYNQLNQPNHDPSLS